MAESCIAAEAGSLELEEACCPGSLQQAAPPQRSSTRASLLRFQKRLSGNTQLKQRSEKTSRERSPTQLASPASERNRSKAKRSRRAQLTHGRRDDPPNSRPEINPKSRSKDKNKTRGRDDWWWWNHQRGKGTGSVTGQETCRCGCASVALATTTSAGCGEEDKVLQYSHE